MSKEAVNHPPHYGGDSQHEVIRCLEAWGLEEQDALAWNAVKYLARAYRKGAPLENFKKAAWYALRRVAILEGKDPGFYNDLIKAVALPGAVRVKIGRPPGTEKMRKAEDPDRARLRRKGKRPCDAPDCEHAAKTEWEGFHLCRGHRELAPMMPARILDAMRLSLQEERGQAEPQPPAAPGFVTEAQHGIVRDELLRSAKRVAELKAEVERLKLNVAEALAEAKATDVEKAPW